MHPLKPWLGLLKPVQRRLWLGALLLLLTLLSAVSLLGLSGWFITATGVTALAWAAGMTLMIDIYTPGGGIRFFALARTVGRYLERVYNHDTVLRLLAQLRQRFFIHLTHLDPLTLARWRTSQWVNRLITDIETLDNLYLRLLAPPLVALFASLVLVSFIAFFHLQAALFVGLGLLLLLLISTLGMGLSGTQLSARITKNQELERSRFIEHLQGLGSLQASHALAAKQQQRIMAQMHDLDDEARLQRLIAWGQGLQTLILQLLVAGCLLLLASVYQQGGVSGPVLVMLPLALLAMQEAFQNLPAAFAHWGGTLAAAERLNQANQLAVIQDACLSKLPDYQQLAFESVSLNYAGHTVLSHFNLQLNRGEKLAVLAASGSGKSTLAALIAGQIWPQSGQIILKTATQPVQLHQVASACWLEQLGYLTQQTELIAAGVSDNLRLAKPEATDDELWHVLEQVDLAAEVAAFPDQLNTWVGETGQQLSGGQARRLALARVMLKDAPFIILDEPFRGIDPRTRDKIRPHLDRWLEKKTALLLGHDLDHLPQADRQQSL